MGSMVILGSNIQWFHNSMRTSLLYCPRHDCKNQGLSLKLQSLTSSLNSSFSKTFLKSSCLCVFYRDTYTPISWHFKPPLASMTLSLLHLTPLLCTQFAVSHTVQHCQGDSELNKLNCTERRKLEEKYVLLTYPNYPLPLPLYNSFITFLRKLK